MRATIAWGLLAVFQPRRAVSRLPKKQVERINVRRQGPRPTLVLKGQFGRTVGPASCIIKDSIDPFMGSSSFAFTFNIIIYPKEAKKQLTSTASASVFTPWSMACRPSTPNLISLAKPREITVERRDKALRAVFLASAESIIVVSLRRLERRGAGM